MQSLHAHWVTGEIHTDMSKEESATKRGCITTEIENYPLFENLKLGILET